MSQSTASLSWRNETVRLFRLAGPLIVNNLSIAGMQFADAVMAGRLGASTLAAVAVGAGVGVGAGEGVGVGAGEGVGAAPSGSASGRA